MPLKQSMPLSRLQIFRQHLRAHLAGGDFGYPAEFFPSFGRIIQQSIDFGSADVAGLDSLTCTVELDDSDQSDTMPSNPSCAKRQARLLAHSPKKLLP